MTTLKAIVFDLDGTLIHSAPDLQLAANAALKSIDRAPLDLATIITFIGNGVETLVRRVLAATGGSDAALEQATLRTFLEVYAQNVTTHTRPYAGVVTALEQFRASDIRLGICTNKPTEPAVDICEKLDLAQYFDVIVGAEPDQPKKPEPQSLLTCVAALDCAPDQAMYVGDSDVDCHTARNATVAFRLFEGGYLNTPLPNLDPSDQFADWDRHGIKVP